MKIEAGLRVRISCLWKKKIHGLIGTVSHQSHKLVYVRLDSGKTVATKAYNLHEPDLLDKLADAI